MYSKRLVSAVSLEIGAAEARRCPVSDVFLATRTAFPWNNSAIPSPSMRRWYSRLNSKCRECRRRGIRARFLYRGKIVMASVEQSLGGRAEGSAFAQRPSRVCLRSFFAVHLLLPGSPSPTPRNPQVAGVRAGYRHRLAAVPVSVIAWSSPGSAAFSLLTFFFIAACSRDRNLRLVLRFIGFYDNGV